MGLFSDHWNNDYERPTECSSCAAARHDYGSQYCNFHSEQAPLDKEIRRIAYEQLKKEFEGQ